MERGPSRANLRFFLLRATLAVALACAGCQDDAPQQTAERQTPPGEDAAPASQPRPVPDDFETHAVIRSIEGIAEARAPGSDERWQEAHVGARLTEGSMIRTGFGSSVELEFPKRGTVWVSSAAKVVMAKIPPRAPVKIKLSYGSLRVRPATKGAIHAWTPDWTETMSSHPGTPIPPLWDQYLDQ